MAKSNLDHAVTKLKDHILGPGYELSFSLITSRQSRLLNHKYRGKDKPTNILSFPLTPTSGEIVIDRILASREAKVQGWQLAEYYRYLLIHGLLHLKGFVHGSKMESKERQLAKLFSLTTPITNDQQHRRRIRHRNLGRQAGDL